MSLKQEIETWVQALSYYDNNEFEESLKVFDGIADTSKILFNCGVIHATIAEHDRAVECYQRAIKLDKYLAVAYFQQGVSNFLVGDFEEALANFNDTLLYLRGNTYINYEQLGLKFKLYSCEVLFNRGLCYVYLQQEGPGMQDFKYARKEKMTPDHDVIDDAIKEKAVGYTVFSIPVGVVYRPNEAKVKNLKTKDYLGKARLIATSNSQNISTGFQGAERKQALVQELLPKDDRPPENISYAATNLVQRGLSSRGPREQSAPPVMSRNLFPPTPPPETEKPGKHTSTGSEKSNLPSRTASMRNLFRRTPQLPKKDFETSPRPGMLTRSATVDASTSRFPMFGRRPSEPLRENSWPSEPSLLESPNMENPRKNITRTASESQAVPTMKSHIGRSQSQRAPAPLFRETTPIRPFDSPDSVDDVYSLYSSPGSRKPRRPDAQHHLIDEEDEYVGHSDMLAEVMRSADNAQSPPLEMQSRFNSTSGTKRPEMRKIRVKVHANDDTRYIMVGAQLDFGDFESKIREKFGIKEKLKIRMKDEGDMITMGDQDDLDMLLQSVRSIAKKERNEMGKMEVWITWGDKQLK